MKNVCLLFLSLLLCLPLSAQQFSEQVEAFVQVRADRVAITNVTLVDGTGGEIKTRQTIVLEGDKITAVGDHKSVKVPQDAKVINGKGKTVIPGLVMMHEHLFYSKPFENWFSVGQMTFTFPRLYLAGGVTTMRTAGSIQPQTDLNVKKWISEGKMTGPKMDVTSPFIEREGYEIPELGYLKGTGEVSRVVNFWADQGVTSFKLYNHVTRKDMKVCVTEAHARGLKVTGHLCSVTYGEASSLGIDNLEHGFMVASDFITEKEPDQCDPFEARKALAQEPEDSPKAAALIAKLIKNGTAITATPCVFEPYTGHEVVPGGGQDALAPQILESVQKRYDRGVGRDSTTKALFEKNLKWLRRFYDQGGQLMAGTDPTGAGRTVAGYANQRTIEILVEAGFPLADAIRICTRNGAEYLGQADQIGTVEVGKTADLVLIDGDLRKDIRAVRKMEIIFKDGVGFDSQKLFGSVKGFVGIN